jgi:hypothetical protein
MRTLKSVHSGDAHLRSQESGTQDGGQLDKEE